jgi:hypothetical protein
MITTTAGDLNEVEFVSRDVAWFRKNVVGSGGWIRSTVKIHTRRPGLEPGPIATGGNSFARWALSFLFSNEGCGVWVPAQGRDDVEIVSHSRGATRPRFCK